MEVVLGFSFGHRNPEPGSSNEAMAEVIRQLAPDIIVVQCEIGKVLRKFGIMPHYEVSRHHKLGRYLDTEEVACQMLELLRKSNFQNAIISVIAHPAHLPRCIRILRKLGITTTLTPVHADIPYDPKSHQIWTRSPFLFRIRETIAFPIYLLRGYYTA